MSAYHSAWHASVESAMHSDFELIDWHKQAAHFVAKACAESLAPAHPGITWRHLAHNVANHCRMARLCSSMKHEQAEPDLSVSEDALKKQIHTQFEILASFLENNRP